MAVQIDALIIGGGPAGMAAALRLVEHGVTDILIVDRNPELGGILNQCIHDGFGLQNLGQALTGPEYVSVYAKQVKEKNIEYKRNACVLHLYQDKTVIVSSPEGMQKYKAKAVILAMGCKGTCARRSGNPGYPPCWHFYGRAGTAVYQFVPCDGWKRSCDLRLRRYWADYGAQADAGRRSCKSCIGTDAICKRPSQEYPPVSGRL